MDLDAVDLVGAQVLGFGALAEGVEHRLRVTHPVAGERTGHRARVQALDLGELDAPPPIAEFGQLGEGFGVVGDREALLLGGLDVTQLGENRARM